MFELVFFWFLLIATVIVFNNAVSLYFRNRELNLKRREIDGRYYKEEKNSILDALPKGLTANDSQPSLNLSEEGEDVVNQKDHENDPGLDNKNKPIKKIRPQATKILPVRNDKEWEVYYEPAFIRQGKSIEGVTDGFRESKEETAEAPKSKRPSNPKAMMRDFKKGIRHQSI